MFLKVSIFRQLPDKKLLIFVKFSLKLGYVFIINILNYIHTSKVLNYFLSLIRKNRLTSKAK